MRNETIFREMNEWTVEANDERGGISRLMDAYLCECSDRRCTEPIHLTRPEYEAVRAEPVRFAIALNHENPELDLVVSENPRFATVEKFSRVGVQIARASDPRRRIGRERTRRTPTVVLPLLMASDTPRGSSNDSTPRPTAEA